ncbi:hypothetical protein CAPTEDRAFT_207313 [Capitella teleta]|uniref:Uncharacterized protein n=1 Tax=Capitella teleta TaxID=283909 RepID=R7UFN7_CAPTE|nr:hypothetical protein CAPTEDRAFT_207313 [Capitella teleta]|eukprot:ELU02603.1 hypothetical protein CAPTEDRAFT_207313 [Capitella teleta]
MEVNGDVSIEQSEQLLDLPDCLDTSSDVKSSCHFLGHSTPKSQTIFFAQIIVIYIAVTYYQVRLSNIKTTFYLVLSSNSSFDFYPDNTVANYTTRLPRDIELSGGMGGSESSDSGKNDEWHYRKLDPGYYANKGEIVDAMVKELKRSGVVGEWDISWNAKNDLVCLNIPANIKLMMDKNSNPLLSFSEKSELLSLHSSTKIYSTSKGTLNQHLSALYVYCNIVKPRVVGDSMVSLLRSVPVTKKHGENVFKSFHNVHYVPLSTRNFHDIEIDIRDDTVQGFHSKEDVWL